MRVKRTGEFYIGLTNDYVRRWATHKTQVYSLFKRVEGKRCQKGPLPCYAAIAKSLVKGHLYCHLSRSLVDLGLDFSILFQTTSLEEARLKEVEIIKEKMKNKLCLNVNSNSKYGYAANKNAEGITCTIR